jgi:type II secretory pathway pseudopilin PulG
VVIAVIAILAALLLPALASAKRKPKLATCQSNFHQIYIACSAYANDFNDYFPICTVGGANNPPAFNNLAFVDYTEYFSRSGTAVSQGGFKFVVRQLGRGCCLDISVSMQAPSSYGAWVCIETEMSYSM